MLDGRETELRPHLNHQVQVTGRLDSTSGTTSDTSSRTGTSTGSTATTTGSRSTSTDTAASGARGSANNAQRLHVESVRMISSTCPSR
jgi:hypothetical protein